MDFACYPGSFVHAAAPGKVTKIGYPYGDDLEYRYVEVTDSQGFRARYFYVQPAINEDEDVAAGEELGVVQALGPRYPGITEHVHFEVIGPDGEYCNPEEYLCSIQS